MIRRIRQWLGIILDDNILEKQQEMLERLQWNRRILNGELFDPKVYKEYWQWLDRVNTKHLKNEKLTNNPENRIDT